MSAISANGREDDMQSKAILNEKRRVGLQKEKMEERGIDPLTSRMLSERSTI